MKSVCNSQCKPSNLITKCHGDDAAARCWQIS